MQIQDLTQLYFDGPSLYMFIGDEASQETLQFSIILEQIRMVDIF